MKKSTIYFTILTLALLIQSCGGAPENFTKGYEFFNSKKYDSSLHYFNKVSADDKEWLDSANTMKAECFNKITKAHQWKMLGIANKTYAKDKKLIKEGAKHLQKELISIWKKDSMDLFYKIIDEHKDKLPKSAVTGALNKYEEKMLFGYEWKATNRLKGQKLYFVREIAKDHKGKNQGNKIQGKSNKTKNGWNRNSIIYRNICYDSLGSYNLQPRIFKGSGSRQYFSRRGSLEFISKDKIKINYEQRLRGGGKVTFVRSDKLKPKKAS